MAKKKKKDETEKNTANNSMTKAQKQVQKAALSAAKEGAPDWIKQKEKLSGKSTEKKAPDPTFGTNSVKVKATADGTDIKLDMPEKAVKNWVKTNVSQRAKKKKKPAVPEPKAKNSGKTRQSTSSAAVSAAKEDTSTPLWIKNREQMTGNNTRVSVPDPTFGTGKLSPKLPAAGVKNYLRTEAERQDRAKIGNAWENTKKNLSERKMPDINTIDTRFTAQLPIYGGRKVSTDAFNIINKYATNEERSALIKVAREKGQDAYGDALASVLPTVGARADAALAEKYYNFGKYHPIQASIGSLTENLVAGPISAEDNIKQYFQKKQTMKGKQSTDEKLKDYLDLAGKLTKNSFTTDMHGIDPYDIGSMTLKKVQAERMGAGERTGSLKFVYDTGMSVLDSLLSTTVYGGLGSGAASLNMAANAASNEMISAYERGGSDEQIMRAGVAAGIAEFVFEKVSIDHFLKIKDSPGMLSALKLALTGNKKGALRVAKTAASNMGKQALIEGSEETLTEIANIFSDAAIMDDKSETQLRKKTYMEQGLSESEARKKAFLDNVSQVAMAGAGGALSGFMMGSAGVLLGNGNTAAYLDGSIEAQKKFYENAGRRGYTLEQAEAADTFQALTGKEKAEAFERGRQNSAQTQQPGMETEQKAAPKIPVPRARTTNSIADEIKKEPTEGKLRLLLVQNGFTGENDVQAARDLIDFAMGKKLEGEQRTRMASSDAVIRVAEALQRDPEAMVAVAQIGSIEKGALPIRRSIEEIRLTEGEEAAERELFLREYNLFYTAGKNGDNLNTLWAMSPVTILDRQAAENAYRKGVKERFYVAGKNGDSFEEIRSAAPGEIIGEAARAYQEGLDERAKYADMIYAGETREGGGYGREDISGKQPGLVMSDEAQQLTPQERKNIAALARKLGKRVYIQTGLVTDDGRPALGKINDAAIYADPSRGTLVQDIIVHEFSHRMKQLSPESWQKYADYAINDLKKTGRYDGIYSEFTKHYDGMAESEIHEEMAADYAYKMFDSEESLTELIRQDKPLAEKIKDVWFALLEKLGRDVTLKRAKNMWKMCLTEAGKTAEKGGNQSGAKYMFIGKINGYDAYRSDFPESMPQEKRLEKFKERIAAIFNLGRVSLNTDTKKITVAGDKFTMQKNVYGDEKASYKEADARIDALYDLADILRKSRFVKKEMEASYKDPSKKPKNAAHKNVKYWYKFRNTIVFDGDVYDVTFNIRDKGKEQIQYLMTFVHDEKKTAQVSHTVKKTSGEHYPAPSSNSTVTQPDGVVKGENSSNGKKNSGSSNMLPMEGQRKSTDNDTKVRIVKGETEKAAAEIAEKFGIDKKKTEEGLGKLYSFIIDKAKSIDGIKLAAVKTARKLCEKPMKAAENIDGEAIMTEINANSGETIGTLWKTLEQKFPEIFSEEYTSVADRLARIGEVRSLTENGEAVTVVDAEKYNEQVGELAKAMLKRFETIDVKKYKLSSENRILEHELEKVRSALERERASHAKTWDIVRETKKLGHKQQREIEALEHELNTSQTWELVRAARKHSHDLERENKAIEHEIGKTKETLEEERARHSQTWELVRESKSRTHELARENKALEHELGKAERGMEYYRVSLDRAKIQPQIDRNYTYLKKKLLDPKGDRYIPEHMRGEVAKFLSLFNDKVVRTPEDLKNPEKISATEVKKAQLYDTYCSIMREALGEEYNADNRLHNAIFDADLAAELRELKQGIPTDDEGNFVKLSQMTPRELNLVGKMIAGVNHAIVSENKLFREGIRETVSQLGDAVINESENVRAERRAKGKKSEGESRTWGEGKSQGLGKLLDVLDEEWNYNELAPRDLFERIGGTMKILYSELRRSENDFTWKRRDMIELMRDATEKLQLDKISGKNAEILTFRAGGAEIRMTRGQVMSLYALFRRGQARQHILTGGVTIGNTDTKKNEQFSHGGIVKLTEGDVNRITSVLTDEEISCIEKVVGYMSGPCSKMANEVSMKLHGYEKYGEKWYFPIKVTRDALTTYSGEHGEGNIRTQSFTKKTDKRSVNPIEINDFFETAISHIDGISLYSTMALPMLDMERVMNYAQYDGQEGDKTFRTNVRSELKRTYGAGAVDYINKLFEYLNGQTKVQNDKIGDTLISWQKKAAIGMNIRVLLQQPTAIIRATYFLPNIKDWGLYSKDLKKEMLDHSAIAYWKSLGFRDIGLGRSIYDIALGRESMYDNVAMGAYGKADDMTWTMIWGAVKKNVERMNPGTDTGSAEFMKAVSDEFDRIIDASQVVDTPLHRTQSMRSKNAFTKAETAFMSEPLKMLNMLRTEMVIAKREGREKKTAVRLLKTYVAIQFINAIAQSIPDLWRDRDEDEWYTEDGKRIPIWKKWKSVIGEDFLDNMNPVNMLPYAKSVLSIVSGFSQKNIAWQSLEKLYREGKNLIKGDDIPISIRMINLAGALAAVRGISINNAFRDMQGAGEMIYRQICDGEYGSYMLKKWEYSIDSPKRRNEFFDYYKQAVKNGHLRDAELILVDYTYNLRKGNKKAKKALASAKKDIKSGKETETGAVLAAMNKLYKKTKDESLFFSLPPMSVNIGGKSKKLDGDDYKEYAANTNDRLMQLAYELVQSDFYQGGENEAETMTDEEKIKAFKKVKSYAASSVKKDMYKSFELDKWEQDIYSGESIIAEEIKDSIMDSRKKPIGGDLHKEYLKNPDNYEAEKKKLEEQGYTSEWLDEAEESAAKSSKAYKKDLSDNKKKLSAAAEGLSADEAEYAEKQASAAATYYTNKKHVAGYSPQTGIVPSYEERAMPYGLSIEEYIRYKAGAKTAAQSDGNNSLKKSELWDFINSTTNDSDLKRKMYLVLKNKSWK